MKPVFLFFSFFTVLLCFGQEDSFYLLKPDRVFDGEFLHKDWIVLIRANKIEAAGPMAFKLPANTRVMELKGATLLPGLLEGHAHLFLHPYNEVSWDDQVLKESRAERTARAVNHAKATLLAGFTTVRDLGTEGAQYDDAGLKAAIEKGIIPGPRMLVTTRAIVAKGAYGPKYGNPEIDLPQGAAEVSTREDMAEEVRTQISKGADLIKIYADYRWGPEGRSAPTFSVEEIAAASAIAKSSGRLVAAHASTKEGIRRAVLGGVSTIEHGDEGDEEVFQLMKEKKVALCPTLAAGEMILQYRGWKKGTNPEPERIGAKKRSLALALKKGLTICMGGDVGVYAHGENAIEMELMVEYGMKPLEVLRSATSVNADVFGVGDRVGRIRKGLLADLVAVHGDPSEAIKDIRNVVLVIKDGKIYLERQAGPDR